MLTAHRPKQQSLQLVRLIACLWVVAGHAINGAALQLPGFPVWHGGYRGVHLFFVLSGYVMIFSSARLERSSNGWLVFLQRRAARIIPMYWIATSVVIALRLFTRLFHLPDQLWYHALASYVFLPYYHGSEYRQPLLEVGWSLNFEAFFYVLFAFALLLKRNLTVVVASCLTLCVLAGLVGPTGKWSFYTQPVTLEFVFGMLLVRLPLNAGRRVQAVAAFVLATALATLFLIPEPPLFSLGVIWIGLPSAVVVGCMVLLEPVFSHLPKLLLYVADATYVIYLFHMLVFLAVFRLSRGQTTVSGLRMFCMVAVLLSLCVGLLIHRCMEAPIQNWLRQHWRFTGYKTLQAEA